MQKSFVIEARSYGIAGIVSHNFLVLRDDQGSTISQLHGLATDRNSNNFKAIGFFKDRLGFYEFNTEDNDPSFISKKQRSAIVFQSVKDDVLLRWNRASSQVKSLNQHDLDYSPLGLFGFPICNSNSAYCLYARLMDIPCYRFSGILEPGINNDLQDN